MFAELLTSVRRSKLRFLPVVFIFIVTNVAVAQDKIDYCELSPAVKEDLKTVDKLLDEDPPFQVRRQRQLVLLQELVKKHPIDFHVQRRYLDTRMSGFSADRDALIAEYRAQMEKNPNDPVAVYLYTRLLVGRRTKEAIQLATKVTQESPEFPWPHYQLAEIYSYPNFRDPAKLKEHLKVWSEKCPTNLTAIGLISRFGDKETMSSNRPPTMMTLVIGINCGRSSSSYEPCLNMPNSAS
jgi:hypothetical protein